MSNREGIRRLLKGIETGDPESVKVVNETRYVQHNPMTAEGSPGLADLFAKLARTNPRVVLHRMFEDGDFVFGHVTYDFDGLAVGFEVFRFEDGQAVEHWDNLQQLHAGENQSGRSMTDGTSAAVEVEHTERNRELVRSYSEDVLRARDLNQLERFVAAGYIEHRPHGSDGISALHNYLARASPDGSAALVYDTVHRVLAEGNFVLCAAEGSQGGTHVAIYDLFRIEAGLIVEHWESIESIAPREAWRNDNGKF